MSGHLVAGRWVETARVTGTRCWLRTAEKLKAPADMCLCCTRRWQEDGRWRWEGHVVHKGSRQSLKRGSLREQKKKLVIGTCTDTALNADQHKEKTKPVAPERVEHHGWTGGALKTRRRRINVITGTATSAPDS